MSERKSWWRPVAAQRSLSRLGAGFACATVALCAVGCAGDDAPTAPVAEGYPAPVQTDDGWPVASLTHVGLDSVPVVALLDRLANSDDHRLNGLVVAKDGKLILEAYYPGREIDLDAQVPGSGALTFTPRAFDRDTPHLTSSCAKSVISVLAGIALDAGLFAGLETRVFAHFPEYAHLSVGVKSDLTVGHLLTMRTGLPWDDGSYPIWDPRNDEYQLLFNPDPTGFVLAKPAVSVPGSAFEYNSGAAYLVAELIAQAAGEGLDAYAARVLFGPLGITEVGWQGSHADDGMVFAGGLYLRPRDMAKIGQLMLDGGAWQGRRIVSAAWVEAAAASAVAVPAGVAPLPAWVDGYGRMWWRGDFPVAGGTGAVIGAGWGGQFIIVLPEVGMVVVMTGDGYLAANFPILLGFVSEFLLPAAIATGPGG